MTTNLAGARGRDRTGARLDPPQPAPRARPRRGHRGGRRHRCAELPGVRHARSSTRAAGRPTSRGGSGGTTPGPLGAVAAAVLAASPHNTQPWIFGVGPDAIDVFVDSARSTGTVDPLGREQYVGLGCAVENLVLGCRARGLQPTVTLLPDGADGRPGGARRAVQAAAAVSDRLYDAIGERHTNRGPYDGRPVPAETLDGPGRCHRVARTRRALDHRPGDQGRAWASCSSTPPKR